MKYLKLFVITLLAGCFSLSALSAEDTAKEKPDTHAGIEITVNINTASAEELSTLLVGIGIKKAESIVEYRSEHGEFKAAEDLQKVKGIGAATVEKNKDRILL
ncbi:DNA uptake protein [Vibrio albus]|uniref:DNA uptake protein n=1 Tax=Vibrio albus TaxID=2200953 RepID=A0A2U3BC28_9VIBR|nr:helix-hairpin-helix domain-containing protein [Vibrio albus]PWI34295.1 DNA uptake protein [Vibrio albus]